MLDVIIKNATVVNADGRRQLDVAIKDGIIVAIGMASTFAEAHEVIDAGGLHLLPGAIDSHTHVRDPGRSDREDFASATRAAGSASFISPARSRLTHRASSGRCASARVCPIGSGRPGSA